MANNSLIGFDLFQRPSENPLSDSGNWTNTFGSSSCQISASSYCEATAANTTCGVYWSGTAWTLDQTSEVVIQTLGSSGTKIITLNCRWQTGAVSGYQLNLVGGISAVLYKATGGSFVSILTTSATPVAGDTWSLQAAGSLISVWQNGVVVGYVFDTTYASGVAGFQFYTDTIASAQISSWRGYSAVQQDGIWTKQGIIVPAIASDLASSGQGTQNPCIIYEGNAQILSGTVYKMWFNGGKDLCYAESTDGLVWTRYGASLISGTGAEPCVIKNGSTYHLYVATSNGSPNILHYTSSDGIAWSGGATVFSAAAGGNWDSTIFYFSPVYIDGGGTWYALYTGCTGNTDSLGLGTGLATSPDGVTWTRHVGNPVVRNFWGQIQVTKVGSTFYAWGQTRNPGQGSIYTAIDPGEGLRMQTTDFITWTNPVHSTHHSQLFEAVNGVYGGDYVSFPFNVGTGAILYSSTSINEATSPVALQIAAALGPAGISVQKILTQNEDAFQQIVSDSFVRADGGLGANWTTISGYGNPQIVSHVVEPSANSNCGAVYSGTSFSNDQYSSVTIGTLAAGGYALPIVRGTSAAQTYYACFIHGATGAQQTDGILYKNVAGSLTALTAAFKYTPQIGDVFTISAVGNVISLLQNGYLLAQAEDYISPITSGLPGLDENPGSVTLSHSQITAWAGGNTNVIPSYVTSVSGFVNVPTFWM